MSVDQYCTFLVEQGSDHPVGGCTRALPYTIWSISELPDHVVQWLAGNSRVVGPGGMGQQYRIAGRGQARHDVYPHLIYWVQVDWTINSGD